MTPTKTIPKSCPNATVPDYTQYREQCIQKGGEFIKTGYNEKICAYVYDCILPTPNLPKTQTSQTNQTTPTTQTTQISTTTSFNPFATPTVNICSGECEIIFTNDEGNWCVENNEWCLYSDNEKTSINSTKAIPTTSTKLITTTTSTKATSTKSIPTISTKAIAIPTTTSTKTIPTTKTDACVPSTVYVTITEKITVTINIQ